MKHTPELITPSSRIILQISAVRSMTASVSENSGKNITNMKMTLPYA